jgi:hypothetical protein
MTRAVKSSWVAAKARSRAVERTKAAGNKASQKKATRKVSGKGADRFERLAEALLRRPDVSRGTMMGFPCLRASGGFFACVHHEGDSLIVKLPARRVADEVDIGQGEPFAPAGRVFREWLLIPLEHSRRWKGLLEEAYAFVSGDA